MVPRMESSCYEIVEYGRERYHKQGYILLTRTIEALLQNLQLPHFYAPNCKCVPWDQNKSSNLKTGCLTLRGPQIESKHGGTHLHSRETRLFISLQIRSTERQTEDEAAVKATTFMEFEELLKNEEIDWRQLCKMLRLKEGDNNAKFFHNSTNAHKRSNYIDLLEVQRGTLKEPDRKQRGGDLQGMHQNAPTISEEEKAQLQASFEEQEVFSCLKKCAVDKDPRLDGCTMNFFIKCWDRLRLGDPFYRKETKPEQGDLGNEKIEEPSKALKMKWLWRYTQESHSQRKCDQLKYGEMDGWVTKEANNPRGVTVWRSIRNWWPILLSHTIIAFNDGRRNCLLERQDRTVADMWSPQG
ncbi:hypothetical protein H5410_023597 [Solanum commersonii]|uniref:Uncharacterized protein n=1 Tax=Solanum commersonii TaxID=4109 RepID=A0A9J5ZJS1_SOLCO|nr:hypothetical protein H5410_023597 [Solanum commersonii]